MRKEIAIKPQTQKETKASTQGNHSKGGDSSVARSQMLRDRPKNKKQREMRRKRIRRERSTWAPCQAAGSRDRAGLLH